MRNRLRPAPCLDISNFAADRAETAPMCLTCPQPLNNINARAHCPYEAGMRKSVYFHKFDLIWRLQRS